VGFNSCYHLSDVISFVSGRHLVIFDPHCTALPAVSAADPGKRIDFVASRVAEAAPDQFAPYQVCIDLNGSNTGQTPLLSAAMPQRRNRQGCHHGWREAT